MIGKPHGMKPAVFSSLSNLNWFEKLTGDAAGVVVDVVAVADAVSIGVQADFHDGTPWDRAVIGSERSTRRVSLKLVGPHEGSFSVTDIENRLARLEDIEEIKQLKAKYLSLIHI